MKRVATFALILGLLAGGDRMNAAEPEPLGLLIVAPHSDDEAIGCTGVILRALAQGKRVGVVIVTAGDGFPRAAAAASRKRVEELVPQDYLDLAALRQRHSIQAMKELGVPAEELMFLGYPDGGLAAIYQATGDTPYQQLYTKRTETYGNIASDYHTLAHGQAAPYLKTSVTNDLVEILRARRPRELYVTGEADTHADHRVTFWFVRDAARTAGYQGIINTFIVHGPPLAEPPGLSLKLTDKELKRKRSLLEIYQQGVSPVHDNLAETYTQPEERFWPVRVAPNASSSGVN